VRGERFRSIGIQLQRRFHARFDFPDIFLVDLAPHVVLARRDGKKLVPFTDELAIDHLDVRQQPVHARAHLRALHLCLEFFYCVLELTQIAVALDAFGLEKAAQPVRLVLCPFVFDCRYVA
jgi:hypothetical protein